MEATPIGYACPGVDITFTCHKTSNTGATVSNVRWRLTRSTGGSDVIPQLSLSQSSRCSYLYSRYNNLPILVTLYNSYSTLNITADDQLDGLMTECVLVSDTTERETIQIQITRMSVLILIQSIQLSMIVYRATLITN